MEHDHSEFYIKDWKVINGNWDPNNNYNIYHEFNLLSNNSDPIITWLQHNFTDDYINDIIELFKTHSLFGKHCRFLNDEMIFTICFIQEHPTIVIFKHIKVKLTSNFLEPKKSKRRLSQLFRKQ